MSLSKYHLSLLVLVALAIPLKADVIAPTEDVMTSAFFFPPDSVRGYAGDLRPVFRVSTNNPFGLTGAETIYLKFNSSAFASYTTPVSSAILTMTSIAGGQNADADAANPFIVSAHGVSADPFTTIIDNTNPGGSKSALNFYNQNILGAGAKSSTVVNGFGLVNFDVTELVNSWIAGSNSNFYIALTGKNDTSGLEFLHGFANNSNNSANESFSYLTVSAVPEPSSMAAIALVCAGGLWHRKRKRKALAL